MDILNYEAAKFPEEAAVWDPNSLRCYSPQKARSFFLWHQAILQERVHYLIDFCSQASGIPYEKLYSFPEGAVYLWRWFLQNAQVVPLPLEEREKMHEKIAPQLAGHPP